MVTDTELLTREHDVMLSLALSTNGFLPIIFTLVCISCYHRMTWHIIALSFVPICLSTISLAFITEDWTYNRHTFSAKEDDPYKTSQTIKSICGSADPVGPGMDVAIQLPFVWAIYLYCLAWALWCVAQHFKPRKPDFQRGQEWSTELRAKLLRKRSQAHRYA